MRFNQLDINPAKNPAILDTATWDPAGAWDQVQATGADYWHSFQDAAASRAPLPASPHLTLYVASEASYHGVFYCLAGLADGQQVFLGIGPAQAEAVLGPALGLLPLPSGDSLGCYPADAATLDRYFQLIRPDKGPHPLGATPRLGIGTRMTTAIWPGIWRAMAAGQFAANAIQNSVRELNLLDDLLAARPAEKNIAFNFGEIESGYTGSTFEGLWVAGVLAALQSDVPLTYGADADHLQMKRGPNGLARARRLATAARYYSFFTLDVSDVLDYQAFIGNSNTTGGSRLEGLTGKYRLALDAVEELYHTLRQLKGGAPFDLELSIDEHPPEVNTFDCLTTPEELRFVLLEMQRRGIPLTHVAPNIGIQKGADYRGPDGLAGLEARTRHLSRLAQDLGVMLDVHSGDDLSAETRRALRRATAGRLNFKISPQLQLLFAEVLAEYHPGLFRRWWDAAQAYARRAAAAGSAFAAECLRQTEEASRGAPSAHDSLFHHFSFAFVGQRDASGQFIRREEFYSLSPGFYAAYQDRVALYLQQLASDIFG
jgi:hypothetical protein